MGHEKDILTLLLSFFLKMNISYFHRVLYQPQKFLIGSGNQLRFGL